jgi:glutaredoxin
MKTETQSFTFDKQLKYGSGEHYAADFYPNHQHIRGEIALAVTTLPVKEYHCLLGHANKRTVMDTVAHNNIVLTQNTKDPCPHCVKAKVRMKDIPKQVNNPSNRKIKKYQLFYLGSREPALLQTDIGH